MTSYRCPICGDESETLSEAKTHVCESLHIAKIILTTDVGNRVYSIYCQYCEIFNKPILSKRGFAISKWSNQLLKFYLYAKESDIDTTLYIKTMYSKRLEPVHWLNADVKSFYFEFVIYKLPIRDACSITEKTLLKLGDTHNCNVSDIFEYVTVDEIIELIQKNRISPWILLNSVKFKHFFERNADYDQIAMIRSFIRPDFWKFKFLTKKAELEYAKQCVRRLGI